MITLRELVSSDTVKKFVVDVDQYIEVKAKAAKCIDSMDATFHAAIQAVDHCRANKFPIPDHVELSKLLVMMDAAIRQSDRVSLQAAHEELKRIREGHRELFSYGSTAKLDDLFTILEYTYQHLTHAEKTDNDTKLCLEYPVYVINGVPQGRLFDVVSVSESEVEVKFFSHPQRIKDLIDRVDQALVNNPLDLVFASMYVPTLQGGKVAGVVNVVVKSSDEITIVQDPAEYSALMTAAVNALVAKGISIGNTPTLMGDAVITVGQYADMVGINPYIYDQSKREGRNLKVFALDRDAVIESGSDVKQAGRFFEATPELVMTFAIHMEERVRAYMDNDDVPHNQYSMVHSYALTTMLCKYHDSAMTHIVNQDVEQLKAMLLEIVDVAPIAPMVGVDVKALFGADVVGDWNPTDVAVWVIADNYMPGYIEGIVGSGRVTFIRRLMIEVLIMCCHDVWFKRHGSMMSDEMTERLGTMIISGTDTIFQINDMSSMNMETPSGVDPKDMFFAKHLPPRYWQVLLTAVLDKLQE